jgi:hypothetical protein
MLDMLGLILALFLYYFTLVATLLLICGLLIMLTKLVASLIKRQWEEGRKLLWIVLLLTGGFVPGMALGYSLRPSDWWKADYVGSNPDIYRNAVEHAADQIFLFLLFCGDLGAILAGIVGWKIRKRRLRPIDLTCGPEERHSGQQWLRMSRIIRFSQK